MVKNYIATEFLYDYLKDKRSVGVIDEDPERGHRVRRRADRRRARAAADHQPDLDRAVQVDRRRQDAQRDHLPARRRARRAAPPAPIEILQRAGEAAGLPPRRAAGGPRPDARRLAVPLPPPRRRPDLDHRRPEGRRGDQRGRQAVHQRRPGNAPVYLHRSADVPMAVVDLLISKTFDASVICPAEQTLRRRRRDPRRGGRRVRSAWARACSSPAEVERARRRGLRRRRPRPAWRRSGARAWTSPRSPASTAGDRDKVLVAPLPSDLDELGRAPARAGEADAGARPRALAVGRARARRLRARHRARRPRPHLGGLRRATRTSCARFARAHPHRPDPRQRADRGRRARRHLQPR